MSGSDRPFAITALTTDLDRTDFSCGVSALDEYFVRRVTQDVKRRYAACYVAIERSTATVAAYYTIAAASLVLGDLPDAVARRLPRYPFVPAARIGRLAVDLRYRRRQLGAALLIDAIGRAARADIPAYAVVVDARDETAARFYAHHGFTPTTGNPLCLFLPIGEALRRRLVAPE